MSKVYVKLSQPQGSFYDPSCKENENVVVTNQIPALLSKSGAVRTALNNNRLKEVTKEDATAYWTKHKVNPESFTCVDVPNPLIVTTTAKEDATGGDTPTSSRKRGGRKSS